MPVTITQIEIYKSPIKLHEPFITSLGPIEFANNVIVVIRTDQGFSGFGECSPFLTINGESMETCFIVGQYLAKALIGKDALNIEACMFIMDKTIHGNSSIKSAFDIALYDIAAQHAALPLYKFLGGINNKTIVTDYTVSIDTPDKMTFDAVKIKEKGYRFIKVKLGGPGNADIERIQAIRQAIGIEIPLRIDANQGWEPSQALALLKTLSAYNIQHCEEPIARWNFMALPMLKQNSPIPIMADECCFDEHDAERLISLSCCDLINIKLGKSSGIFKAQKIIQLAEAAGIKLQLGGFLESRLGFTAAAHLSLTSDNIIHYDFDTPLMFIDDPVTGGIRYKEHGEITITEEAGLGATVSADYLQSLTNVFVQ